MTSPLHLRPRVVVFDVNETLLDLRALDPLFQEVFGTPAARGEWFQQLLRSSMTEALTLERAPLGKTPSWSLPRGFDADVRRDFSELAAAALSMVAARRGLTLKTNVSQRILRQMRTLPPHEEVPAALAHLQREGLRLAALTNSSTAMAQEQLSHAGLRPFFQHVLSVDGAGTFKPAPEVYRYAAHTLAVAPGELMLVAAHDWDITGALRVGCRGAFVARQGMVLDAGAPQPELVGADLQEVCRQILRLPPGPATTGF